MSLRYSTAVSPNAIAIDVLDSSNVFSMIINGGTCYAYEFFVTDTDFNQEFTTGVVSLITEPVFDGEELSFSVDLSADLSYGNTYYWYVNLYSDSSLGTFITDRYYTIYSDTPPTLDYLAGDPLVAPSGSSPNEYYDVSGSIFNLRGTYTQVESVDLKSWYFSLYDDSKVLIRKYSATYDKNIVKEFDGLISGRTYWVEFTVETINGYYETSEKIKLVVDYENVPATINPTATNSEITSGITTEWGGLVYILGSATSAPTYFQSGDYYYIQPNADIEFEDFEAISEFNVMIDWGNINTSFDGDIAVLDNTVTGESLTITYNNAGTQMELYYDTTLIDSISFSDPTSAPGRWLIFVNWDTGNLTNATL